MELRWSPEPSHYGTRAELSLKAVVSIGMFFGVLIGLIAPSISTSLYVTNVPSTATTMAQYQTAVPGKRQLTQRTIVQSQNFAAGGSPTGYVLSPGSSHASIPTMQPFVVVGAMALLGTATGLYATRMGHSRGATALRHHGENASGQPATPALLLDCDGTIVDTERDGHRVSFNQAFAAKGLQGVEWGVELYGELLTTGGGKERMTRYFKDYAPHLWPDKDQPPSPSHPLIVDLHKLKTRLFMDIIESGSLPLRPGIKSIVEEALASGWQLAVCSTSNEKAVQAVVDKLLDGRIKHIFAGDMVAKKKPDPAIYNLAAKELGLDPAHCVVLEDSRIGLLAARAAGMACVVTKSTYTAEEDFTEAQLVVDDLGGTGLAQLAPLLR